MNRRRTPWLGRTAVAVLLAFAAGCTGVEIRRACSPAVSDSWRASAVTGDEPSPRTLQTLRRWDLEAVYRRAPWEAMGRLRELAARDPQPDLLFALAEVNFLLGRDAERRDRSIEACASFYLCAGYAYHYLFADPPSEGRAGPELDPRFGAFDPRFRLACDLYNASLARCIRHTQKIGRLDPRQQLTVPTPDGQGFTLSVVHRGFDWKPEEFGPLLFCEEFRVAGLANHYRTYGLGVPLIGTRAATAPSPPHAFYPRQVAFPVTAFFRFEGSVADLGTQRCGQLELLNPLAGQALAVAGRGVPLETDLTTPLAYFLAKTDLQGINYTGFLRADEVRDRSGIYMFEPYQPGKIPVLMVHGLLSSPLTWAEMFNDLRADPYLRSRFQFWFYLYPTGSPYLLAAADLRANLRQLRRELDPNQTDAALDQMVCVGHSMGGLVSRLLTEDSGDDFWKLVSDRPLDALKLKPENRDELQRVFYFEKQPTVKRVVFLGTPHHGSDLSPSLAGRLAVKLVRLPKMLMAAAQDAIEETQPGAKQRKLPKMWLPTSVDLLAPESPALELLSARPRPPEVHFHSIIGVLPPDSLLLRLPVPTGADGRTDGVVPYSSAHLADADSELIVPAEHRQVHHHPLAVLEVRRILLEHLRNVESPGVVPASATVP